MRFRHILLLAAAAAVMTVSTGQAQTLPSLGGSGSAGSVLGTQLPGSGSGLMDQALPNVSSASSANTTGLLSYCVKNNYLKGDGATSMLSRLTGKSGNQTSSAFTAGQQGNLETGNGSMFSLSDLKDKAKSKVCDMVLQHAQSSF